MPAIELTQLLRATMRASGRCVVALLALLVATSFGALEITSDHAYDDEHERDASVIAAASDDVPGDAEDAERGVPEERDDDEEERDDDERTDAQVTTRAPSSHDGHEKMLRGDALSARRAAWAQRGERGGHARMIDRPPHA
ncbi:MAG: hypothetical protein J0L92_36845 [Deltaproteobacteria bacterium]|nr:hypothetical protein [Deltaproteobacteria bacterium]